ncbi:hypothetical protein BMETH_2327312421525, partial [methanotrophic bacterial endosymbiont of Bathymodiolus sp.]
VETFRKAGVSFIMQEHEIAILFESKQHLSEKTDSN